MTTEPVALQGAVAGAINVTLGLLSFFGVDQQLVGALQVAAAAWIVVIFVAFVRNKVTPNADVALTTADAEALAAANPRPPDA